MHEEPDDIPASFRSALKGAYPTPAVPRGVDERVLRGAYAHLVGRRRRWWIASAAAAVIVAGVTLSISLHTPDNQSRSSPAALVANDLNHDGQFNILDALAAAKGGAPIDAVDQLASAVVRMEVVQ